MVSREVPTVAQRVNDCADVTCCMAADMPAEVAQEAAEIQRKWSIVDCWSRSFADRMACHSNSPRAVAADFVT